MPPFFGESLDEADIVKLRHDACSAVFVSTNRILIAQQYSLILVFASDSLRI